MIPIILNQSPTGLVNNIISMEIDSSNWESKVSIKKKEDTSFKPKLKNRSGHLNIETIRKMIQCFLIEKQIPKQKLAKSLGITVKNLLQLSSPKAAPALIPKINLPLVKLYCSTKFEK